MIEISKLRKSYGSLQVLKGIDLSLPDTGLIGIVGESGCGKTTLLNTIAGLLDFEGDIVIDKQKINKLSDEEKGIFRINNFGFIYQDYKLFNNDNVYNNVIFPLSLIEDYKSEQAQQRISQILSLVKLKNKKNEIVKNLSGGEKQRTSIARCLVCDSKIILADEPTGALDEDNAHIIFKLLLAIAKHKLVIVVSHNVNLLKQYANRIIELRRGVIVNDFALNNQSDNSYMSLSRSTQIRHAPKLSISFLFRHYLIHQKERKYRQFFSIAIVSICLLSIGLAFSLSSSVSSTILRACGEYINSNNVVITPKEENQLTYLESSEYEDVLDINAAYNDQIYDVGTIFTNDFNSHFKTINKFYITDGNMKSELSNLNASKINEYYWLDVAGNTFYPKTPNYLKNDEIALGLNLANIQTICLFLKIERSVSALSMYLANHDVRIVFDAANSEWGYDNQELFTLKAFCLSNKPCIFHYNHQWNRYIFEDRFRLPSTSSINTAPTYPWSLKKINYLYLNNNRDEVLLKLDSDKRTKQYFFEIANHKYFPSRYDSDYPIKNIKEVLVFNNYHPYFTLSDCYLINKMHHTKMNIIGSNGGYGIYPYSMMMGFSHLTFFSANQEVMDETLSAYSSLSSHDIVQSENNAVMLGFYAKPKQNSVIFEILDSNNNNLSLDEIVISRGLYEKLKCGNNVLYVSYCENEKALDSGKYLRNYFQDKLRIVNIIEDERYIIYHHFHWPIMYFKCNLGVSTFELIPNALSLQIESSNYEAELSSLSLDFPKYDVINPMQEISNSVNDVADNISYVLLGFSSISLLVSIVLLSLTNYLNILDSKKEIGLVRCIGASRKEAQKILFFPSIMSCLISYLLSSGELLLVSLVINYMMSQSLQVDFVFSFSPISLLLMFLVVVSVTMISNFFISRRISKLSPLEAMRR